MIETKPPNIMDLLNDGSIASKMIRSALIAMGLYEIAVTDVPRLLEVIYRNPEGYAIVQEIEAKIEAKRNGKK